MSAQTKLTDNAQPTELCARGAGLRLTPRIFKPTHRESRLTDNGAVGNACNVADVASLPQAVRHSGANNVVILGA